jgi:hypothetical protein
MRLFSPITLAALGLATLFASSAVAQGHMFTTKRLIGWADPMDDEHVSRPSTCRTSPAARQPSRSASTRRGSPLQSSPVRATTPAAAPTTRRNRERLEQRWRESSPTRSIRGCYDALWPDARPPSSAATRPSAVSRSRRASPASSSSRPTSTTSRVVTYDLQQCPDAHRQVRLQLPHQRAAWSVLSPPASPTSQIHDLLYIGISQPQH